jgi:hypothetical protein
MFVVNWFVSSLLLVLPPRTEVSYTFFRQQTEAGNVAEIARRRTPSTGRFERR